MSRQQIERAIYGNEDWDDHPPERRLSRVEREEILSIFEAARGTHALDDVSLLCVMIPWGRSFTFDRNFGTHFACTASPTTIRMLTAQFIRVPVTKSLERPTMVIWKMIRRRTMTLTRVTWAICPMLLKSRRAFLICEQSY